MDEALGLGDLDLSYQLTRSVGIDMATPAPIQAAMDQFDTLLNELEALS